MNGCELRGPQIGRCISIKLIAPAKMFSNSYSKDESALRPLTLKHRKIYSNFRKTTNRMKTKEKKCERLSGRKDAAAHKICNCSLWMRSDIVKMKCSCAFAPKYVRERRSAVGRCTPAVYAFIFRNKNFLVAALFRVSVCSLSNSMCNVRLTRWVERPYYRLVAVFEMA